MHRIDPKPHAVTAGPKRHFFGYYEKCPWNDSMTQMLVHEVDFDERPPGPDDAAVVGIVRLDKSNRFEPIGETLAWNFQQGAMSQWVGPNANRFVLYNVRDEDRFASVLCDLHTGEQHHLSRPVAALSRDGRFALSLNFARLADMRPGYGYVGTTDPWVDVNSPEDDGIYLMDLKNRESRLIVSISQVVSFGSNLPGTELKHWFNHVYFNPDGTRFSFFHRWEAPDGQWSTRLLTANTDGSDLYCLSDSGTVSHYDWLSSKQLLAWARKKQILSETGARKLINLSSSVLFSMPPLSWALRIARRYHAIGWVRQRVIGDRFILFTDLSQEAEDVGVGTLREDAHCSYSPDRRWILLDTYPHEDQHRRLLLFEPNEQRIIEIGRFFSSPERSGEIRCDLHARWSRDGKQVCFDSSHEGGRQMYVIDVSDFVSSF